MSHHSGGAWDDDRIDRLLRESLDVEPSPSLAARVRTRIGAEAVPGSSPLHGWLWGACAVVAAVALAVLRPGFGGEPIPAAPGAAVAVSAFPAVPYRAAVRAAGPLAQARVTAVRNPAPGVTGAATGATAIFAPADRAAFAMLLAYSRTGQLPPIDSLPPASPESNVVLRTIEISIIDIPRLVVSGPDEGEPQ